MERRIRKVTQETIDAFYPNLNLVAFYRKVAEEFRMPVEEGHGFGCTKIRIAPNIQEQWCGQFEKEYGEARRGTKRLICVYVCLAHAWKNICGKMK